MFTEKKRENEEKKGKVMKKGEEKRGEGGPMGSMGNRYEVFQRLILPGRQREQECGCCLLEKRKGSEPHR